MKPSAPPAPRYGRSLVWPMACLAALVSVSVAIHSWVNRHPADALVATEARHLRAMSARVWESVPDPGPRSFKRLDTLSALQDSLVPASMLRDSGAPVRNVWGGPVELFPHGVLAPGDGFLVRYSLVPSDACVLMVQAMEKSVYDIRVGGASVLPATGATQEDMERACQGGQARMDFIFHPDLVPGTALRRS